MSATIIIKCNKCGDTGRLPMTPGDFQESPHLPGGWGMVAVYDENMNVSPGKHLCPECLKQFNELLENMI